MPQKQKNAARTRLITKTSDKKTKLLHTESTERTESLSTAKEKMASEIKVTFPKDVALLRCIAVR